MSIAYPPDTRPQFEEEEKTKPGEMKLITRVAATWSAVRLSGAKVD